jgi:hypothetical protein
LATSEIAVPDERAGVGVAWRQSLALGHQAARANEPRHSAQRHSTLVIL